MVSSSGGDCHRDAAAESTVEEKVKQKQADSKQEEAAVAAAPSDQQKGKREKRPEKEAHEKKRSEKEVRKRKPAVAATSQTQTVIDGTARPGMDAQKKDLESLDDSSSGSASDTCSFDPFNRGRDFWSPTPPNSPYHFWSEYETPTEFRRRVGRRSGGHGKR